MCNFVFIIKKVYNFFKIIKHIIFETPNITSCFLFAKVFFLQYHYKVFYNTHNLFINKFDICKCPYLLYFVNDFFYYIPLYL